MIRGSSLFGGGGWATYHSKEVPDAATVEPRCWTMIAMIRLEGCLDIAPRICFSGIRSGPS